MTDLNDNDTTDESGVDSSDLLDAERMKERVFREGFKTFADDGCPDAATWQLRDELRGQKKLSRKLLERCFMRESELRQAVFVLAQIAALPTCGQDLRAQKMASDFLLSNK